jgi:hypothetical protein
MTGGGKVKVCQGRKEDRTRRSRPGAFYKKPLARGSKSRDGDLLPRCCVHIAPGSRVRLSEPNLVKRPSRGLGTTPIRQARHAFRDKRTGPSRPGPGSDQLGQRRSVLTGGNTLSARRRISSWKARAGRTRPAHSSLSSLGSACPHQYMHYDVSSFFTSPRGAPPPWPTAAARHSHSLDGARGPTVIYPGRYSPPLREERETFVRALADCRWTCACQLFVMKRPHCRSPGIPPYPARSDQ